MDESGLTVPVTEASTRLDLPPAADDERDLAVPTARR